MIQDTIGLAIVILCYVCLGIIIFAPTMFAAWLYLVARKVRGQGKRLLRTAISVFIVNALAAYLLGGLAYEHFFPISAKAKDAAALAAVNSAVSSEIRFFESHGKFYPVGPVRGPYKDDRGITVEEGVILEVIPDWDKEAGREVFRAHAVHIWGSKVVVSDNSGEVRESPVGKQDAARLRERLLNSVR